MPSLNFVLPHWLYWAGLILFPLAAMILARRTKTDVKRHYEVALGYLILITGGMLGLHRFYMRNLWGFLFIPVFIFILYSSAQQREARIAYSNAHVAVQDSQNVIAREEKRLADTQKGIDELKARGEEEGSFRLKSAERKVTRAEASLDEARKKLVASEPAANEAAAARASWSDTALYSFYLLLAMLAIDAVWLPWLIRKANAEDRERESEAEHQIQEMEESERKEDASHISSGWTGVIDRMSYFAGEFVSYWAVIAVFVYYYEVVARYVFNSPTNWAHEGMFLMFGMQYLIAGSYAMLTETHVRVDIFYAPLSPRRKAFVDLLTSVFFFIFAGTLLVTSYIFAYDATKVQEISFTEWGIHYWPMKWAMVVGGLLLVLQGVSKLTQDIDKIMTAGDVEPRLQGS